MYSRLLDLACRVTTVTKSYPNSYRRVTPDLPANRGFYHRGVTQVTLKTNPLACNFSRREDLDLG